MLLYKDRLDSELILDKAGIQLEDGTVEVEVIKLSPSLNPTKKR